MQDGPDEDEGQGGLDEGRGSPNPEMASLMDILWAPWRSRAQYVEVRL